MNVQLAVSNLMELRTFFMRETDTSMEKHNMVKMFKLELDTALES
jgi:hypothetical protein